MTKLPDKQLEQALTNTFADVAFPSLETAPQVPRHGVGLGRGDTVCPGSEGLTGCGSCCICNQKVEHRQEVDLNYRTAGLTSSDLLSANVFPQPSNTVLGTNLQTHEPREDVSHPNN